MSSRTQQYPNREDFSRRTFLRKSSWERDTDQNDTSVPFESRGSSYDKYSTFFGGRFQSELLGLRGGIYESDDDKLFRKGRYEVESRRRSGVGRQGIRDSDEFSRGEACEEIMYNICTDRERDAFQVTTYFLLLTYSKLLYF